MLASRNGLLKTILLLWVLMHHSEAATTTIHTNASCVRVLSRPVLHTRCGLANGEACWGPDNCAILVQQAPAGLTINLLDCSSSSSSPLVLEFWIGEDLVQVVDTLLTDVCDAAAAPRLVTYWQKPLLAAAVTVLALGPVILFVGWLRSVCFTRKPIVHGAVWY
jgi:hypothetical protein